MKWCRFLIALLLAAWTVGCASLPSHVERTPSQALAAPAQTPFGQFVALRRAQDHARSDSGFVLLAGVEGAYAARVALIRGAQRTLDLQYYAVHADSSTEVLLEEMRKAARRGVRIRLLLDDFNTVGKDAQVLRLAFEPNVEIRLFNPLPGSRESLIGRLVVSLKDAQRIAKRMHNKMFIADAALGITGGRNLGDAYFGGDGKSNFVDIDVLAAGRIVQDMETSFDRYWNDELAYPMQSLVSAADLERLRKPATDQRSPDSSRPSPIASAAASQPQPVRPGAVLPNVAPSPTAKAEAQAFDINQLKFRWAPAVLLQDKPGKVGPDDDEVNAGDTVVDGLLDLIDGAKQDVLIVSPYFVPGSAMMDRFRRLKERGVRVRVLTNSLASNDAPAAHAGYAKYRKALLDAGVELHELHAGEVPPSSGLGSAGGGSKTPASHASLHSKVAVIDGRLSVIGSMNLDLRSKTKNSEVGLVIRSASFAKGVTARVEDMLRSSYQVVRHGTTLLWRAPPGANFPDARDEPGATMKQRALAAAVAVFAPEEML